MKGFIVSCLCLVFWIGGVFYLADRIENDWNERCEDRNGVVVTLDVGGGFDSTVCIDDIVREKLESIDPEDDVGDGIGQLDGTTIINKSRETIGEIRQSLFAYMKDYR